MNISAFLGVWLVYGNGASAGPDSNRTDHVPLAPVGRDPSDHAGGDGGRGRRVIRD